MVCLLLGPTESRGSSHDTVKLLGEALDLAPSLTSSLRATLVVRVDLLARSDSVQVAGQLLAKNCQLVVCLVSCDLLVTGNQIQA